MKVHLVHTNDLHDRFPLKLLESLTKKETLLLDSGDAIGGSNLVYRFREPILEKMNQIGYRAMAMGNREFHYSRKVLSKRLAAAQFPILSANVVDLRNQRSIIPWILMNLAEIKLGILGLTVPQYPEGSPWEKITGWRFLNPIEAVKEAASQLRQAGAEFILCLSHLGFPFDKKMAKEAKVIDVILGGHSHTILSKAYWQDQTAILQTGAYGHFIGSWELEIEAFEGKVKGWKLDGALIQNHD